MRPVHWIQTELARHYENLDLSQGVDLDRNGKIEGAEKTDQNGDGNVDSAEWQKFVGDNKAALEKLGGFFKTYYSAGTAFKPDNPIHDLLAIESELASPDEVDKVYEMMEKILHIVEPKIKSIHVPESNIAYYTSYDMPMCWNPYAMMLISVYDSINEVGIEINEQTDASFINNINDTVLDCDSSSLVVLAIAHELNWPVYLVSAPGHVFVRWDNGTNVEFNMDERYRFDDDRYIDMFNISWHAIEQGVYMRNFENDDILSLFYSNRGIAKRQLGRYEEAIRDYDKAIELNQDHATAYNNRGMTYGMMERYEDAINDFDRAIELDPNMWEAYDGRALTNRKLGSYKEAFRDRKRALEINPSLSCLCNTVGTTGNSSPSDPSLLSLLLTVIFE